MLDCDDNQAVLKEARRYTRHPQRFNANWSKAMPLLMLVLEQIERHDLPGEFALLPYVESHYRQLPPSGNGPAGMWQLMGRTAVDQGLKVSRSYDERLDALASTAAAIGLLERYDRQFSDWRLADMAFNAGEYRIKRALGKQLHQQLDSEDLAGLKVSSTTHQHLARLMALSCIINDPQRFSVTLPQPDNGIALQALTLPSAMDLRLAAALAELPLAELLRFNAAWSRQKNPSGPTTRLLLPQQKVANFNFALTKFPPAMLSDWHLQTIDVSTTLDTLASSLETPATLLASANQLDPTQTLHPGKAILLPGRATESESTTSTQTHTIRRGDTLSAIARHYGVRLADLLHWNALSNTSILRPGAILRVHAPTF
ncbi:MAG TPA: LysM peptidoglycan-binding domain-containing protein [Dokdonella sp.]|uniref:LysM peptidoglycan-binding domain-containing protein n=1 Tax=Dokdonella sp. TaxID=2291710 RepID=UPI002D801070|nr:LysM peptidoglycan-binding domain-containing protein [Dokdonella sp.]HET9034318.1 LysM peptidoglycan-binding domain-containing protein [Dokdonella sp.]